MVPSHLPTIGDWYLTPGGATFEVVAFDEEDESVEIQYFDGAVEEVDLETWLDLGAEPTEPREDWTHSYDMSREDVGNEDVHMQSLAANPLNDPDL